MVAYSSALVISTSLSLNDQCFQAVNMFGKGRSLRVACSFPKSSLDLMEPWFDACQLHAHTVRTG